VLSLFNATLHQLTKQQPVGIAAKRFPLHVMPVQALTAGTRRRTAEWQRP
jgi:hypothetical protein